MSERSAFLQLYLSRLREFLREPEVVFWVFGFPVLLAIGLGIAFRNKPPDEVAVGIVEGPRVAEARRALSPGAGFRPQELAADQARRALRLGKVDLVVVPAEVYEYVFDPTRPESVMARQRVDDALQRGGGRRDPVPVRETHVTEPGARYIDFLIPGLIGMNIMSGGMWGVGFVIVDMRARRLLKRLLATPMRRADFLGAMMASRLSFVFTEVVLILAFGWLAFDLVIQGSLLLIALLAVLGGFVFSGLGLLVASRARKIETVSGLMNLVMLPMWVFSGVFFSADRFPEAAQPLIRALPLTALNDALRAVILEGAGLASQAGPVALLAAWAAVSFVLALKLFRWT
jgi:ABC transporter DrrB family efflux protein